MIRINDNFEALSGSYLFSRIASRVKEYQAAGEGLPLIRMDIGDVSRPLAQACVKAMEEAVKELSSSATFKGYGPERGYGFLREAICLHDYSLRGIEMSPDDIFISDGAKPALGALGDILPAHVSIAVSDPGYPVYADAAVMDGHRIITLAADSATGFIPVLPEERPDVIILCFPGNPTGVCIPRDELQKWVDYARRNDSLIIYDSAYEAYIRQPERFPRSIYECEGAEETAIEVRSFSKTAGFTGVRCGYTVVPRSLRGCFRDGKETSLNYIWNRRQSTKFNGASYISQKAAAATFSPEGRKEIHADIDFYMSNAAMIRNTLRRLGITCFGGTDSPYIWMRVPDGYSSEEYFELLLSRCGISATPGSGFGRGGEGYLRLTGFNTKGNTEEAMHRLESFITNQQ